MSASAFLSVMSYSLPDETAYNIYRQCHDNISNPYRCYYYNYSFMKPCFLERNIYPCFFHCPPPELYVVSNSTLCISYDHKWDTTTSCGCCPPSKPVPDHHHTSHLYIYNIIRAEVSHSEDSLDTTIQHVQTGRKMLESY